MRRALIIIGLVAAVAIPPAAIAASHGSGHKAKSGSTATAPKTKAKGSAQRSGLAITMKRSKNVPATSKTKASAKPKAGTRSGSKPKSTRSAGTASTSVQSKRNKTAGTPRLGVTLNQRGGSAASGKKGIGGIALPISLNGISS
jgi:hypothetical protein